jgi:anti-anti-sigma regulatory factor
MTEDLSADGRLVFEGALTMRSVKSNFTRLQQAIATHDVICVDCHAAEDIDLTFIQLLVAARKTAERSGKRLCLSGPAEGALFDTLTRAGFMIRQDTAQGGPAIPESYWFSDATA